MASIKIYSKEQTDALLPTSAQLVPSGGSTGQVLTKSASGTEWTTPSAGINVVQSTGSSTSDVMSQNAVTSALPSSSQLVPSGGTDGQVLTKVSGSPAWADVSGGSSALNMITSDINDVINTYISAELMWTNPNSSSNKLYKIKIIKDFAISIMFGTNNGYTSYTHFKSGDVYLMNITGSSLYNLYTTLPLQRTMRNYEMETMPYLFIKFDSNSNINQASVGYQYYSRQNKSVADDDVTFLDTGGTVSLNQLKSSSNYGTYSTGFILFG